MLLLRNMEIFLCSMLINFYDMKKIISLIVGIIVFSNVNGFSQNSSDSIKFVNSTFRHFEYKNKMLTYIQAIDVMKSNPLACQEVIIAETNKEISNILRLTGLALIAWPIISWASNEKPNLTMAGIGAFIFVIRIPFTDAAECHSENATRFYNQGLNKSKDLSNVDFKFGLTNNGIGIRMTF